MLNAAQNVRSEAFLGVELGFSRNALPRREVIHRCGKSGGAYIDGKPEALAAAFDFLFFGGFNNHVALLIQPYFAVTCGSIAAGRHLSADVFRRIPRQRAQKSLQLHLAFSA